MVFTHFVQFLQLCIHFRKSIINDQQWRSNFYLVHQRDYGSWRWIKWKLIFHAVTAFIALEVINYFNLFHNNWSQSVPLSIVFYFSNFWHWTYYSFLPIFIFIWILRYIVADDAIGLKKELRVIAYYFAIITVITTMHSAVPYFSDQIGTYWMIIWRGFFLLLRCLLFLIMYVQTRYVVRKYGHLIRHRSENSSSDPRAINLTSRRMRHFAHESTFCLVEEESEYSLTVDEKEAMLDMRRALMISTVFEQFMVYIFDVCTSVCTIYMST